MSSPLVLQSLYYQVVFYLLLLDEDFVKTVKYLLAKTIQH